IATAVNKATTIGGTTPTTDINDNQTATPFSAVTFADPDTGESSFALQVTLDDAANGVLSALSGGSYNAATGVYTLSNVTLATAQAAIRTLVFTPTAHQVAPGATKSTHFTI